MDIDNTETSLFDGTEFAPIKKTKVVNVSSVPNRSPFRYPGGKTWLVPTIRKWLSSGDKGKNLIEPFCGGGTVSLTATAEGLVDSALMVEMDKDIAAVWRVILSDGEWLANEILSFDLTAENVIKITSSTPQTDRERAFATIIRNRTNHGGILAPGSGMLKKGDGKGLASRWYPYTLAKRIRGIALYKKKLTFVEGDAFDFLDEAHYNKNSYFFLDPPYTVAGKRLYTLSDVNHEKLFEMSSKLKCHFLMTYDYCDYVLSLAKKYGMQWRTIPMQTTHLVQKEELLISNDFEWLDGC